MSQTELQSEPKRTPTPAELGFDPAALREKYVAERTKRLRPDGNSQYREVAGELARFENDHCVKPITRPALHEELDAVIVGGGFGGLLAAARLQQVGITETRIIEKAGDFGGTWYWNRYPGAQCDIESYIYLPLLEETGYIPKEKYSFQPELYGHVQRIAEHFRLRDRAIFRTRVLEMRWDEKIERWRVTTNRGDEFRARFVVMSNGPLNRPKLPGIPGIETFQGHSFHTSRWDYAYTGGSTEGGLTELADKRVAIIGTGATAIQCVPHLGRHAKHLYVFQRTPSSVDVRGNKRNDPEWVKTLTPGWQKRRMENFNAMFSGLPQDEDLVRDGWTDIFRNLGLAAAVRAARGGVAPEELGRMIEISDFKKMNQVRARVDATVKNRKTAESLKPWYRQFCKR